jgi:hypothetical protein
VKKRLLLPLFCAVEFFVILIVLEQQAHAYVDPGSGLLMFQVGGSMLAGACFMLRRKLRRLFRLDRSVKEDASQGNQAIINEARSCEPNNSR